MKYRKLGASDLLVPEVSLGSWPTFGLGASRQTAEACLRRALDLGMNLIDTANSYGQGAAEEFIGETLRGVPRDRYILATKVFHPMSKTDRGLSRAQIVKQVDASLKRLRVDCIDLYQCHRYDPDVPLEETMLALSDVVAQGKVRFIGLSQWSQAQIRAAFAIPGGARFVSSQPEYSLLARTAEREIFPLCRELNVSQIVFSPLAQGVLTGKYLPGSAPPPGSRGSNRETWKWVEPWLSRPVLEAVQRLKVIAATAGCTLPQFAIAWVLREPNVASAIVGASRPEQLQETAAASGLRIDPALFALAEREVAAVRPRGRASLLLGRLFRWH